SEGACPNSTFITGTGATNTTRTPAVARPVINRINSMWAASMVVLPQQQMMNGRAPRMGAPARDSPLPAPVALDHFLDLLLPPRSQTPFGNRSNGFQGEQSGTQNCSENKRAKDGPEGARSPFPQVGREAPGGCPGGAPARPGWAAGGSQPGTGAVPASPTI